MLLRTRATDEREKMDAPDCDPVALHRTYQQFPLVNRAFAGWSAVYRRHLRPLLSAETPTTLLDLGCGGGDVALYLDRLARRDGLQLDITAVDPDPRAMEFAMSRPVSGRVVFRKASGSELIAEGASFDIVVSNHVLHHLNPQEFRDFLHESVQLSGRLVIHSDLRRHWAAFVLFSLASLPLRGSFIRVDGLTSIRRSYTQDELSRVSGPQWRVLPARPFRQLLLYSANHPAGARA